jgi:hypothetical protein
VKGELNMTQNIQDMTLPHSLTDQIRAIADRLDESVCGEFGGSDCRPLSTLDLMTMTLKLSEIADRVEAVQVAVARVAAAQTRFKAAMRPNGRPKLAIVTTAVLIGEGDAA